MSVMLTSVNHDTVVSDKHEERTRHYYVIFQHSCAGNLRPVKTFVERYWEGLAS